ncbi:MAG: hypothetical protein H4O13_02745 [Xanthomonadales bacterium]|nr:hypothetical protein [Xanthomonadales bacterium]
MTPRVLLALATLVAPLFGPQAEAAPRIDDIQRVLPNGQLTREIPAGETVTLRISGVWTDSCTPSVLSFERSGQGRLLNLFWDRAALIYCLSALTPFTRDIPNVRFDEAEIGALPITVVNSHQSLPLPDGTVVAPVQGSTTMPQFEIAIQAPVDRQVTHWPTARQPPAGVFPVTAQYDLSGAWYSPQQSGSGLLLKHERRKSGSSTIDSLWGSWSNFATDGSSQWHVFSETYWASPTRLLGRVLRAEAEAVACTAQFPNPGCNFAARAAREVKIVGIFEITVHGPDELTLTIDDSGTPLLLGMTQPPVQGYSVRLRRL